MTFHPIIALASPEIIGIVVVLAVLLFGAEKLPKLARSAGQAKKEFFIGQAEADADVNRAREEARQRAETAAGDPMNNVSQNNAGGAGENVPPPTPGRGTLSSEGGRTMLAEQPPRALQSAGEQQRWDQKEMSAFTEHLRELRYRLLISFATVIGLGIILFIPSPYVIDFLKNAYFKGIQLHAFGPADAILTEFRFSIYAAIVLGLPVLLYQAWMFIVPAFHPRTRRLVYAYVAPSVLLAAVGIAFAHFVVLPRVVATLIGVTNHVATPTFGIGPTINFILIVFLAFALIFQTPIIMVALARIGVINGAFLKRSRKYFFFGFCVLGAIGAPDGNPLTMAMMALPMYALYEVSLWIIVLLEKSWHPAPS